MPPPYRADARLAKVVPPAIVLAKGRPPRAAAGDRPRAARDSPKRSGHDLEAGCARRQGGRYAAAVGAQIVDAGAAPPKQAERAVISSAPPLARCQERARGGARRDFRETARGERCAKEPPRWNCAKRCTFFAVGGLFGAPILPHERRNPIFGGCFRIKRPSWQRKHRPKDRQLQISYIFSAPDCVRPPKRAARGLEAGTNCRLFSFCNHWGMPAIFAAQQNPRSEFSSAKVRPQSEVERAPFPPRHD